MDRGNSNLEKTPARKRYLRPLVLILAMVLLAGSIVGGTLAWVIAEADPVVNTFVYGNIGLRLEETKTDENGSPVKDSWGDPVKTTEGNTYKMRPGGEYLKDPLVTVMENSEDCWLFIKLEETGGVTVIKGDGSTVTYDFDDYLAYTVTDAWTQLYDAGQFGVAEYAIAGVYYRYVPGDAVGKGISYWVLEDNTVSVQPEVDKEMLNALDGNGEEAAANYPRLTCTAYAVQHRGFEAEISEGAETATAEQVNTAALRAWKTIEAENG